MELNFNLVIRTFDVSIYFLDARLEKADTVITVEPLFNFPDLRISVNFIYDELNE